jgi:ferredoxin-NADP reductase
MPGPLIARLRARVALASDVYDLLFDVVEPAGFAFEAGQFITLAVGLDAEGQPIRRSYSIASLTTLAGTLRFIIRAIPGGAATEYFLRLPPGSEVAMTGPHGFFVLAPHHPGDVVFGATGTGVAPLLPMMDQLGRRRETGRRLLYWGLRQEEDLFAVAEVEAMCRASDTQLFTYLSRPSEAWSGLRGRISAPLLASLPELHTPTFYLVGNGAMITEVKQGLVAAGVERKKYIRTEAFFD